MTSKLTINLIVAFLGATGLTGVIGGIIVAIAEKQLDDTVKVLAGTALGALASLLARTSTDPTTTTNIVADTVESTGAAPAN